MVNSFMARMARYFKWRILWDRFRNEKQISMLTSQPFKFLYEKMSDARLKPNMFGYPSQIRVSWHNNFQNQSTVLKIDQHCEIKFFTVYLHSEIIYFRFKINEIGFSKNTNTSNCYNHNMFLIRNKFNKI